MDRINLFNPFRRKPENYEDRLTWAFLVTLDYDLSLQKFFRELVESQLPLKYRTADFNWKPARIATQTKNIESSVDLIVSVLITDARLEKKVDVEWSDRHATYDGVIEYPDGLTLIVEKKTLSDKVWADQLSPSRHSFSGELDQVTLHNTAICLEWAEVLEGVLEYAYSDHSSYGSRQLAHDFLSFVDYVHPELTPYRTFKLCGDKKKALLRRSSTLVQDLCKKLNLESKKDAWGPYAFRANGIAERIKILVDTQILSVMLHPADTVGQARRFRENLDRRKFLALQDEHNWVVRPNLHFSFISTHLVWSVTTLGIREYLDYFSSDKSFGRRSVDSTLLPRLESWVHNGLISAENRKEIEKEFIRTQRAHINVIPGWTVVREWDLKTVIELEQQEELEETIIEALAAPLATWGESLRLPIDD